MPQLEVLAGARSLLADGEAKLDDDATTLLSDGGNGANSLKSSIANYAQLMLQKAVKRQLSPTAVKTKLFDVT